MEEKNEKVKKNRKELILSAQKYVWKITKQLHAKYFIYTGFLLTGQLLGIALSLIVGKGVDVITGKETHFTISGIMWIIVGLSVTRCLNSIFEAMYNIKYIAYDVGGYIDRYMIDKLFNFSPGQTTKENTGLKMDTLQKGASAISELMNLLTGNIIPTIFQLIFTLSLLLYINWQVAGIVIISISCFIIVSIKVNNRYIESIRRVRKIESDMETKFWEIIKHLRLVIVMATQEKTRADYLRRQEKAFSEGKGVWSSYNMAAGLLRNLPFQYLVYGPLFFFVFYLAQKNAITIGDVAVIIAQIGAIYTNVNNVGTMQRQLLRHSVNVNRLKDLVEQEPECVDTEDAIELENLRGDIEFNNVTFTYGKGTLAAIEDISFKIKRGETIAFVGQSGSGKSTIASLLLRSHIPQSGEITVDGLPLNDIAINSFRKRVALVSQQIQLWDGSVRENIQYGVQSELDPEELDGVIQSARINEFFDRLGEKGLDAQIGDNGIQLSGGQCQRIAIARVLARDPALLILDEATSALDYKTEAEVFDAMSKALIGRTGILIAHRLGTVKNANRIIVLDKGKIVGEGSYKELIENNSHFQKLIGSEIK